ncbi:MAG: DAHL domain-containing protein, partial [Gammaproteobacteria bacterium]
MTLQRFIALLAVGLALAVLGYLLWVTQRNPVDLNLHTARIEQLKSADRADRVLQQQIVRARLNVQGEARGLDEARQALADAYTAVNARSGGLRGLAPEVDAALGIYGRHMTRKLELLEDYAQVLQEYAARFAVLQADGENALRVATESGRGALREQLLALIEEAAAYAIQFSSTDAQRLNELIAQVDRSQQGLRSDIEREAVIRLLSTVAAVRNARDALQTLKTQLDELPTIQALQRLSAEYIAHFDRQTATARRDRRILAVYATALLLAFALIAVRLRRSFSELDQMNAELQRA